MRFILGAICDPGCQFGDLLASQRITLGRHSIFWIINRYQFNEQTFIGLARNDRFLVDCAVPLIKPHFCLARFWIRSMALEAFARKDRTNVPVEFVRGGLGQSALSAGQDQNYQQACYSRRCHLFGCHVLESRHR